MKHLVFTNDTLDDLYSITDWSELGNMLYINARYMAYAYKFRDDMQHKIRLGKRTVYSSDSPLSLVQQRLGLLINYLVDQRPYSEAAIAYRPGLNVCTLLSTRAGSAVLIKTDITKYYDNISFANIEKTLVNCGLSHSGAKLIAHYCCVWNGKFHSLQQGSSCSPAMANLVGNRCFDIPIMSWLEEHCTVPYYYYRYSDNLALFCDEEPSAEFMADYKKAVKDIAEQHTFKTHSWSTIRNNHPTRHQEFLGIVLNKTANIYRGKRDWLRAVLFNACKGNILLNANEFFKKTGGIGDNTENDVVLWKFQAAMEGYHAYVKNINSKFALRIEKLLEILNYRIYVKRHLNYVSYDAFCAIKTYTNTDETVQQFRDRVVPLL